MGEATRRQLCRPTRRIHATQRRAREGAEERGGRDDSQAATRPESVGAGCNVDGSAATFGPSLASAASLSWQEACSIEHKARSGFLSVEPFQKIISEDLSQDKLQIHETAGMGNGHATTLPAAGSGSGGAAAGGVSVSAVGRGVLCLELAREVEAAAAEEERASVVTSQQSTETESERGEPS